MREEELAKRIDQTNLRPEATEEEIKRFIEDSLPYGFKGIALMPLWVPLAARMLKGSGVKVVSVVGFPLGAVPTEVKVEEARWIVEQGGEDVEIDMVLNVSLLKSGRYEAVRRDVEAVVKAAEGRVVKVIIEAPLLSRGEIVVASLIAKLAGADFVKTSTGFKGFKGWRPTSVEDVKVIRGAVGREMGVKASGGIRTLDHALALLEAGADRLGTSSGIQIIESLRELRGWKPQASLYR